MHIMSAKGRVEELGFPCGGEGGGALDFTIGTLLSFNLLRAVSFRIGLPARLFLLGDFPISVAKNRASILRLRT